MKKKERMEFLEPVQVYWDIQSPLLSASVLTNDCVLWDEHVPLLHQDSEKCQALQVQCQTLLFVSLCLGFRKEGMEIARQSMISGDVFISLLLCKSKLDEHMWSLFHFQCIRPETAAQCCNPSIPRQRIEDFEFEIRMNCILPQKREGNIKKTISIQEYLNT